MKPLRISPHKIFLTFHSISPQTFSNLNPCSFSPLSILTWSVARLLISWGANLTWRNSQGFNNFISTNIFCKVSNDRQMRGTHFTAITPLFFHHFKVNYYWTSPRAFNSGPSNIPNVWESFKSGKITLELGLNILCITLLSFQNKITKPTHVEHNKSIDHVSHWSYFTVAEQNRMIR